MRHLLTVVLLAAVAISIGCKKPAKKLTWEFPPDPSLLEVDAKDHDDLLDARLRQALVSLQRVHFALDSTELSPEARAALQDAREKLGDRSDVHLYVEGHADSRGASAYNISLGEARATVVCDYLVRLGMASDRLHVVSWGEEKPLAEEMTEEAFARNRRVEFRVMRGNIELQVEDGATIASR